MSAKKSPQLEPGAREILQMLSELGLSVVIDALDENKGIVSKQDVLNAITCCGANVRGIMELVHPDLRRMISLESKPPDGKVRRTIYDVVRGVRSCAYCLQLANEVLQEEI